MPKIQERRAVEVKIATVVAVAIILHETGLTELDAAMRKITGEDTDYFEDEFAVIDVGFVEAAGQAIDWPALIALFKSYRLNPVAVRNAKSDMEQGILAHGLSLDVSVKPRRESATETAQPELNPETVAIIAESPVHEPAPEIPAPTLAKAGAMIVDTPVRAGQRIYARGCDLVVTAAVNNGAEVIADGSIHIYAPLRGRALAGASGDTDARIFAMSMEAELVSIAGMYRTFDEGLPKNLVQQPVQVSLVGDRIDLRSMSSR